MPKLYSARIIIATLEKAGFSIVSQKGSHIKLVKKKRTRFIQLLYLFIKKLQ